MKQWSTQAFICTFYEKLFKNTLFCIYKVSNKNRKLVILTISW